MLQNRRGGNTLVVFFILLQWSIIPIARSAHSSRMMCCMWALTSQAMPERRQQCPSQ